VCLQRPHALRRYFILDPAVPNAKGLADALHAMLEESLRSQKTVILRIATFTANPRFRPRLSLTPKGEVEISGCSRRHVLPSTGIWIADHPLPFDLPLTRSLTLVFSPNPDMRVRVTEDTPPPVPRYVGIGAALLIVFACYLNLNHLLAAVLAFTGEMYRIAAKIEP